MFTGLSGAVRARGRCTLTKVSTLKRILGWPVRRALDPRILPIAEYTAQTNQLLQSTVLKMDTVFTEMDALEDSVGTSLSQVAERLRAIEAEMSRLALQNFDAGIRALIGTPSQVLPASVAEFLDYAESGNGYRAEADLWPVPGRRVMFAAGTIAETVPSHLLVAVPCAVQAVAGLAPGAHILDLSHGEAGLQPVLAALGHLVTSHRRPPVGDEGAHDVVMALDGLGALGSGSTPPASRLLDLLSPNGAGIAVLAAPCDELTREQLVEVGWAGVEGRTFTRDGVRWRPVTDNGEITVWTCRLR